MKNKLLKYSIITLSIMAIATGIYFLVRKPSNIDKTGKNHRKIIITRK